MQTVKRMAANSPDFVAELVGARNLDDIIPALARDAGNRAFAPSIAHAYPSEQKV